VNQPLIEVRGLKVGFTAADGTTVHAVDGVDLEITEGEVLGLVGESGCGKSTLGRALLRLVRPSGGGVCFRCRDVAGATGAELRETRRQLQMIFQDPYGSLNPRRRVASIVAEPLRQVPGMSRARAAAAVAEMLDRVGLGAEAGQRRPREFSGGQRQRIGIARALIGSPRFVVADEPVSALDVSIQAQVLNLLTDLIDERSLTMLFISHDLGVVRHVADRVAVMYLGQIVELAPRDDFFARPAHPYSAALLSAVATVPGDPAADPAPDPVTVPAEIVVLEGELPDPTDPPPACRFSARCPFAVERCTTDAPELRQLPSGRAVRCHFPLAGPSPQPPADLSTSAADPGGAVSEGARR
jgi:oligopeptide/dipeptide ABC transporter ATP-binding protein